MSDYQYNVYRIFEKIEAEIQKRARQIWKTIPIYRTYTRQACNFVFPYVNMHVNGELRPRPSKFRINEKIADNLEKGKINDNIDKYEREQKLNKYFESIGIFYY